jgi:uncharacterized repeat protein (TIGR03803 family)
MKQQAKQWLLIHGLGLLGLVSGVSAHVAAAQSGTYTAVYPFAQADGENPTNPGMLAEGLDGNVYGTNPSGISGSYYGVLIRYSPLSGKLAPIDFNGKADGFSPVAGVTLGVDGNLYGTTVWGGITNPYVSGWGEVYKFTPGVSAAPVHIYDFTNSTGIIADGAFPNVPPVQTQDGSLWGISTSPNGAGIWYKMNTAGAILNSGTLPSTTTAPMMVSLEEGTLYGTTPKGGTSNAGAVYRLKQDGTPPTVIYSFDSNHAELGLGPAGPVIEGSEGFLYGTTCWGGKTAGGMTGTGQTGQGTVFRVSRDGSFFQSIHSFQDNANTFEGSCPTAGLVQGSDGKIYGTTGQGGGAATSTIQGVLFRLNTDGTNFEILHAFDSKSGYYPLSSLLLHTNGIIYGLTNKGGVAGNVGNYGVLYSYSAGLQPFAKLVSPWSGPVGTVINILGQGFNSATGVLIGGVAVPWTKWSHPTIVSDTWMQVTVPAGAKNGFVTVQEPSGNLVTREGFKITCTPGYLGCITRL